MIQTAYILSVSRPNNGRRGFTGMLLYQQGHFLRILEGEREGLESLMGVIKEDPRHRSIIHLFTREIAEKDFPDWTMGFREFDVDSAEMKGFTDMFDPSFQENSFVPSRVASLLKVFKGGDR